MATLVTVSPKMLMAEHLLVLRDCARSVLREGGELEGWSETEWRWRMTEFLAIGASFRLTRKELVCLVLQGLFVQTPQCGCPACRARKGPTA
jgi:hypothetical protein